ncbi:MAG: ABC transporter permease [Proteobacteria bacterium]|nr:ABC transporter permease [Pseudomonadota bacterium]MDA1058598.1 ABC transporter permease [Pseudomonadota bacterium]
MIALAPPTQVPRWVTHVLVPVTNLLVAFVIAGIIIAAIGEDPFKAMKLLVLGAFGASDLIGFTLYYTTNFIFTGLAVAIAFHCGLFNIGGEGQAYVGGLGVGLVGLAFSGWPAPIVILIAIAASMAFGAAWAFIPGYLQAKRGSHVVITTIMFNFLAAAMITYLLVEVLIQPGQQAPQSREFDANAWLPFMHDVLRGIGINMGQSSLNLSFVIALIAAFLVWVFIWHTRWGYEIRTVGANQAAAVYAGISPSRNIILAMLISGGLAGMVGINEIIGVHHRLILDFPAGFGFVGIAVALMGRNHPLGIFFAALLFGMLYQGGSELSFDIPTITRDLVVVIQGLVILFSGAMEHVFRPHIIAAYIRIVGGRAVGAAAE